MQRVINHVLSIALITLSLISISSSTFARDSITVFHGTVLKIVDGDTVNMRNDEAPSGSEPIRIRMVSTDTAELHLPAPGGVYSQGYWGEQGAVQLRRLLRVGNKIELRQVGIDKYGRALGTIHKRGFDINLEMVASGWAALYEICDDVSCHMESEYRGACRQAVAEGLGLFDPMNPLPQLPFIFRSEKQHRPLSKFVGNYRTQKYVSPENWAEVPICDRVFFITEADAIREGFTPQYN